MFSIFSFLGLVETTSNTDVGPWIGLAFLPFMLVFAVWLVMFLLILTIVIGGTILWILMLIDILQRDFTKKDDKSMWLLVVALTHWVGALIYYFVGRKQGVKRE